MARPSQRRVVVATWAETFLSLCRRLSPTTQETYRRDLEQYVLPRFGSYRLGRVPAEEIELWLNDELAFQEGSRGRSRRDRYETP